MSGFLIDYKACLADARTILLEAGDEALSKLDMMQDVTKGGGAAIQKA